MIFREGKVRAIGVSNFLVRHLVEFESAAVKPAANQCEYHPFVARKYQPVLDYCAKHKITFEAYRNLGGSNKEKSSKLFNLPLVQQIAAAHTHANSGKLVTPGQVSHSYQNVKWV